MVVVGCLLGWLLFWFVDYLLVWRPTAKNLYKLLCSLPGLQTVVRQGQHLLLIQCSRTGELATIDFTESPKVCLRAEMVSCFVRKYCFLYDDHIELNSK
jgi:hypothetical protein